MSRFRSSTEGSGVWFVPYLLLTLFVLLDNIQTGIFPASSLELGLYFVPLFLIGLTAESDATPIIIALLGLINDVSNEMPLGFYAALFVIFYLLSASQKSLLANTRFSSYWLTFSMLVMTTYFIAYLMALVLNDVHLATLPLFLSAVACCTAFPLIYLPLYLLDDKLGGSERS